MKTKFTFPKLALAALLLAAGNLQLSVAFAQGTAFSYQGRLNDASGLANGTYDLTFTLFNTNAGGILISGPVTNGAVSVSNGLFTVAVDFGGAPFTLGQPLWLEIGARTNGAASFATLAPRQAVLSTPIADYALAVNSSSLIGQVTDANLATTFTLPHSFNNAANSFAGDGSGLTALNASSLTTGTVSDLLLSSNVALRNAVNNFTGGSNTFSSSVGIGTTSPAKQLDLTGTASGVATGSSIDSSIFMRVNNTASDGNTSVPDFAGIGFGHNSTRQAIVGGTFGNDFLDFYTGGALTAPKMRIDINGTVGIMTNDVLELGYGVAGKEVSAGKIGYERFTPDSLDIVGAGTNSSSRKIKFWAEGGATFSGNVTATSFAGSFAGSGSGLTNVALLTGGNALTGQQTVMSGNVGIGTTTPKHKLDVNGNIFLGTAGNGQVFTELGDTLYLGSSRKYLSTTLGAPISGTTDWLNLMCHPLSHGIMFGTSGPSDADPHSAPNPLMVIQPGGNVGIGTTTPTSQLTVNNSGSPAISLIGSGTNGQVDIGIASFATAYSVSAAANDAVIRQSGKGKLFLQTGSGAAAIAITTNNNVGIGTAAPNSDTLLQVKGMVRMGSETGTSEAPNRSILVRRIHSTSSAAGQVVARGLTTGGNTMTLERDGSNGGLILKLTGSNGNNGGPQISGYGITAGGAFVGVNIIGLANNSSTQIFTDAQKICNCRLSFGDAYNDGDMTTAELMRLVDTGSNNDFFWAGTATSTVNQ